MGEYSERSRRKTPSSISYSHLLLPPLAISTIIRTDLGAYGPGSISESFILKGLSARIRVDNDSTRKQNRQADRAWCRGGFRRRLCDRREFCRPRGRSRCGGRLRPSLREEVS